MISREFRIVIILVAALGWASAVAYSLNVAARHSFILWLDHWTSDWRVRLLSDRLPGQHPRIAIVTVTEDTLAAFPYRSPVDRAYLADLIARLDGAGVATIGLDFLFVRPTEPSKDAKLAEAIKLAKARVVLAAADRRSELAPRETAYQKRFIAQSGAVAGYANFITGRDRIVRYIAAPDDPAFQKSFAASVAGETAAAAANGPRRIAWLLRPSSGDDRFLTVPAHLIVPPAGQAASPAANALLGLLRGRIVLVGAALPDLDRHQTPFGEWSGDDEMSGVAIQAQAAAQLLDGRDIRRVSDAVLLGILGVLAFAGVMVGMRYGVLGYTLYGGLLTAAILAADALLFVTTRQFVPFTAALLALFAGLAGGLALRRLRP